MTQSQPASDPLVAWAGSKAEEASRLAEEISRKWTDDTNAPVLPLPFAAYTDLIRTLDAAGKAASRADMFDQVLLARFLLAQVLVAAQKTGTGSTK